MLRLVFNVVQMNSTEIVKTLNSRPRSQPLIYLFIYNGLCENLSPLIEFYQFFLLGNINFLLLFFASNQVRFSGKKIGEDENWIVSFTWIGGRSFLKYSFDFFLPLLFIQPFSSEKTSESLWSCHLIERCTFLNPPCNNATWSPRAPKRI